jgi:hypothetical protein
VSAQALYSLVYRGILARTALAKSAREKRSESDTISEVTSRLPFELMDEEIVRRAREMSVVYAAIAAFENSARAFIKKRLLEEVGDNWWEECVPEGRRKKAESQRDEENKIRWHAKRGESLLEYTELEDLAAILTTKPDYFTPFVSSIDWAKNIFKTVERSRNIIMHSGYMESEDVERLRVVLRDWLNQIGG